MESAAAQGAAAKSFTAARGALRNQTRSQMKVPRFITRGLASGALRLRPEVVDVIEKLGSGADSGAVTSPVQEPPPEPPSQTQPPTEPSPNIEQRRLVFVSPLPGRWITLSP